MMNNSHFKIIKYSVFDKFTEMDISKHFHLALKVDIFAKEPG